MERRVVFIAGGAFLFVVALAAAWLLSGGRIDTGSEDLTEITDAAAIQKWIQLTHLGIATSETFAGNIRIRNITGTLTNVSNMPVRRIDLKMTFTDSAGSSVQESTHTVFSPRRKPLDPGDPFRFEVNFENLPKTWNYRVPNTEIVKVGY